MTTAEKPSPIGPTPAGDASAIAQDALVPNARPALGPLAGETPDVMTLHTRGAHQMFTGRAADAVTTVSSADCCPGVRSVDRYGRLTDLNTPP